MATFGEVEDSITTILKRSNLTAETQTAIKRACMVLDRENWWFAEADASFTTSSGTGTYSYTTLMMEPLSVMLNVSGSRVQLKPATQQFVDQVNATNWTGQPSDYAIWNGAFMLYPIPDKTYTVSYAYSTKHVSLSVSTDTNGILTFAPDLVEQMALSWLQRNIIRDLDAAAIHDGQAQALFQTLKRESVLKTSSGRLKATEF